MILKGWGGGPVFYEKAKETVVLSNRHPSNRSCCLIIPSLTTHIQWTQVLNTLTLSSIIIIIHSSQGSMAEKGIRAE